MMESEQLLHLYKQGERDFSKLNLKGRSFRNYDLSGANFSGADLRGASFRGAILRGTTFTHAKFGLRWRGAIVLTLALILFAALLGFGAGIIGTIVNLQIRLYTTRFEEVTAGLATVVLLAAFAVLSVSNGLRAGFSVFLTAFTIAVGIVATAPIIASLLSPVTFKIAGAIANSITIVASVIAVTVAVVITATAAYVTINLAVASIVASVFILGFAYTVVTTGIISSIVAVVPCVMLLTAHLCLRALRGDNRHAAIRNIAILMAMRWGTDFRESDLTDADFTGARLRNANFNDAMLTRTRWSDGSKTEATQKFGDPYVLS